MNSILERRNIAQCEKLRNLPTLEKYFVIKAYSVIHLVLTFPVRYLGLRFYVKSKLSFFELKAILSTLFDKNFVKPTFIRFLLNKILQ